MSIIEPKVTTLGGSIEIVHVFPVESEIDRAVRAFEVNGGFKANRAYILSSAVRLGTDPDQDERYYAAQVKMRLERIGVIVEMIPMNTINT